MAFVKGQPKTPGSGRRKKKRNEMTADIKAAFRLHGDECVSAIMKLTKSKDERVRLGALQTALDRGFGKPTQHLEAQVSVYDARPPFCLFGAQQPSGDRGRSPPRKSGEPDQGNSGYFFRALARSFAQQSGQLTARGSSARMGPGMGRPLGSSSLAPHRAMERGSDCSALANLARDKPSASRIDLNSALSIGRPTFCLKDKRCWQAWRHPFG